FLRDFIQIYRENRVLWDKTHPNYKSRSHRDAALESLINKSMQYFPEADLDFVRSKICNLRSTFWREYKKIQVSFWSKHHTVLLIELLRKHPLLYSRAPESMGLKSKRLAAYKSITRDLNAETSKKSSKLWCYDLLSFLEESEQNGREDDPKEDQQASDGEGDIVETLSNEAETGVDKKTEGLDDLFDTIGKTVAVKLRDMSDEQRCYAENLINEIMYNGLMQKLGPCAKISFTED
ncbi:hypothetical protein D910_03983, partial [Dendroctonus ponderosae]